MSLAAEKASDGGEWPAVHVALLTTWKLPGRLCGRWVDTAVCGRGAARGGLECTPARRPERRQEREGTKHTETGEQPGPGCKPQGGRAQHSAREAVHAHTPDTHRNPAQQSRTRQHRGPGVPPVLQYEEGRHLMWPRPWWNVPGAGPVTMASLETPALAEESALKEITWRGSWEIIPKGLEFKAPGSLGLPAL